MINFTNVIEIAATGIGLIAGVVQVVDYVEKKKKERSDKSRWSAPPPEWQAQTSSRPGPVAPALDYSLKPPPSVSEDTKKIVLIYKRGDEDDIYVLKLLETELMRAGYSVFIDRQLQIGVAWASEIERQIGESDAVVVLVSAAAARSEMIEYEVEAARKASLNGTRRPRLLPVRIRYDEPLIGALGAILTPLQFAQWNSAKDDSLLISQILRSITGPIALSTEHRSEPAGGAVPLDSRFYVVRPTDSLFLDAIRRQDSIVLVKGARQIGKTSLLARGIQEARLHGTRVVFTDLQTISAHELQSPDRLFQAFAQDIADQLDLETVNIRKSWDPERGPNSNLERFLRREVLEKIDAPIVWGLDEVDRIFSCPFSSEVFGLFRSWHNRRSLDPGTPWAKLTLAMAYATEAHLFITDLNQSPFNVGTRLSLDDFTKEQICDLNVRHGTPIPEGDTSIDKFISVVGGQPYLVRRGMKYLADDKHSVEQFADASPAEDGLFGDHLRRILITLSHDDSMLQVVRSMLSKSGTPDERSFYRLRSAGIIAGDGPSDAHFRCGLYRTYLTKHL